MEGIRVFVAMGGEASTGKLKAILEENGYIVVDTAADGHNCLRKIRTLKPDLLIADSGLSLMNGLEIAKIVLDDKVCDVILIINAAQEALICDLKEYDGFASMVKPLDKPSLINTIELMSKHRRKINELEKEIEELRGSLDTRKEVEKAKGLLMKHNGLTEAEAFKKIQRQSMDRGIPMKEIAKAIIIAYDI